MTDAMSAGRFPADEPLNALGCRQAGTGFDVVRADHVRCGPELRTRQTAQHLGLAAEVDPGLADLDVGHWRGAPLAGPDPVDLALWLTDPDRAPHGGESIAALTGRVEGWLDAVPDGRRCVAVTHPAVIRAAVLVALRAPAESFWRIDIGPLSRTSLHRRSGSWTLRNPGPATTGEPA